MSRSALYDRQKALGAVFTEDVADSIRTIEFGPEGFPVVPSFEPVGPATEVVHFGDPRKEFQAANSRVVVFDLSGRGHLELTGADRQKFLNGFCTADITNLQPGDGREAFVTNIKGKVMGHVFAFAGEDSLWLETAADSVQPLMAHLSRYVITEDVNFTPRSEAVGEFYLHGPEAGEKLHELGADVSALSVYRHIRTQIGEKEVAVCRVDWLNAAGYLLRLSREDMPSLWDRLMSADVRPAGVAVFHALRIQARFPLDGIDITLDNLAQEVGRTEQAINFQKGCYLGQEPIARIDALGHVNRELRSIKLDAALAPAPGSVVKDHEGKEIGRVTSYAMLPYGNVPIALAYLRHESLKPGTELLVHCEDEDVPAKVL